MPIPERLLSLRLPLVATPMFLVSGPELVIEAARAGILGTFPSLNQRTNEGYAGWLDEIGEALRKDAQGKGEAAPFGVNLIVHKSNGRLDADLKTTVDRKVPVVITSLGAVSELVDAVHSYGGLVFHDVINIRHARKAAQAGVDGIIAVCAGAGGHAGTLSPFALVPEIRRFFDGTIVLSGAMSDGGHIAAARALGADLAYMGTRFIATRESLASDGYKQMILKAEASDVLYTPAISGVSGNFLTPSLVAAGLDPQQLPAAGQMDMGKERA
jgi:nitronate monooxygenase